MGLREEVLAGLDSAANDAENPELLDAIMPIIERHIEQVKAAAEEAAYKEFNALHGTYLHAVHGRSTPFQTGALDRYCQERERQLIREAWHAGYKGTVAAPYPTEDEIEAIREHRT